MARTLSQREAELESEITRRVTEREAELRDAVLRKEQEVRYRMEKREEELLQAIIRRERELQELWEQYEARLREELREREVQIVVAEEHLKKEWRRIQELDEESKRYVRSIVIESIYEMFLKVFNKSCFRNSHASSAEST